MNVGIDIIEISRIKKLIRNKRFLNKVFSTEEVSYCSRKFNPGQHYAVRFAAKEAIWKAVGEKKLTHKDINIINSPDVKPEAVLPPKYRRLQKRISVSLSHTKDFAAAVAVKY